VETLLNIFKKLSIASALIVGWLIVLLLFVGWLIFAYDQAEAAGFIAYVKTSMGVINKPLDAIDVAGGLRLIFAVLAAVFAVIVCVITLPMFSFVYLGAGYTKLIEKLTKRKETPEADPGAAAP
jgi:hypothetical protein